jgi:excisionase family DNA binding protein
MTPAERIAIALERIADHICKSAPDDTAPVPLMLTAHQAATMLGVSARKVYTLATEGRLRSKRIGRVVRFHPADIEQYIDDVDRPARSKTFKVLR